MTKKNKKRQTTLLRQVGHYLLAFLVVMGIVFAGTIDKTSGRVKKLSMETLAKNDFDGVTTDQLSEFYIVASLADSMKLASSELISSNYVTVSVMNNAGQSSSEKLEKKVITDTSHLTRCGVNYYTVADGETMDSIASKYGVNTNQIRWSNGLKNTSISVGQVLKVPGTSGIVYSVKAGETVEFLASKYGSSVEKIITCNDLETNKTLVAGNLIVLPDGSLPEKERPEYVPPRPRVVYTYSYSGSSNSRMNIRTVANHFYVRSDGNPGVAGQCTWYAWYMRATDPRSLGRLPGGLGHASSWANALRSRYRVDHEPEAGAVFQTTGGSYYGHVGYVMSVNGDGSITVREMNYSGAYRVTEAEIPAAYAKNFNYIH